MSWRKLVVFAGLVIMLLSASANSQTTIHSFPAPGPEPRGLTWDGSFLWCGEYSSGQVFKLDPVTGAKVDSFSFPLLSEFGGITWGSEGQIWVGNGSRVYEIQPATGDTLSYFSCPGG